MKLNSLVVDLETRESERQRQSINLIASENYASENVLARLSGAFVNKYAEGTPGKRFYAGCSVVDELECYGQELAKKIFNCQYANLQPLSGACANWIAYFACLDPGDTVLAMDLASGGHLTHGFAKSLTSKIFKFVHYGCDPITLKLDYDHIRSLALEHRPKMIIGGASSYPLVFNWQKLAEIAAEVGAVLMADIAHTAGLIAGQTMENPFPHADIATLTTQKTLRGPRGGMILAKEYLAKKIDSTVMPGFQGGPNMASIAAKIVALEESQTPEFKNYCDQVLSNTQAFCQAFSELGITPLGGGTQNHLLLIETKNNFGLSGKQAQDLLTSINIDVNRNHLPGDTAISSGIRIGTPAMTTRGMKESDCKAIAQIIHQALESKGVDEQKTSELRNEVEVVLRSL